jgi:hypothetical protein
LIVKFTRRGTAPVILPIGQDQPSRPFLTICSICDRWRIPISRNVRSSSLRQGGDGLLDLALATPLCPPACDGAPDSGQPTRVDNSVSADLARRRCEAISRGRHPGSKCSSVDSVFTLKHRYLGARGRRNERNIFRSFAPGGVLVLPSTNLAGDCRYRSRCKTVQRSTVEGKPFEEKPKHRLPDRVSLAYCGFRLGNLRGGRQLFGMDVAPTVWCNARCLSRGAVTPDRGDRRLRIQHRILRQIAGEGRTFLGTRPARRVLPPSWCRLP